MRKTTQTRELSLFEQLLSGQGKKEQEEKEIKYSTKNQNQQGVSSTKSLHNLNDIFYSNQLDYKDFKQSLRYNNKNLRKIALENIKNPHPKIIKNLAKHDLSGLIELKLQNIDITDSKFELLQKKGGLAACFTKLSIVTLNCPQMTSNSLKFLFQGEQRIKYLDLENTKIDNEGIYWLANLNWPLLETFIIQWCTKVTSLDELGLNAQNFPKLSIIDSRFIKTEEDAYTILLNSRISISLVSLRLFGTNVNLNNTNWKSNYLLTQFMEVMRGLNLQEFKIENDPVCVRTSNDWKQMKVNTKIMTEDLSQQINVSWNIDSRIQTARLQFIQTAEQELYRFKNFGKLFEFLSKEWQLRKSLKIMMILFDQIQCDEQNFDIFLKCIVDFKEIRKLKLVIKNQQMLKPISYFFTLNQLSEMHQIIYLQIYKIINYQQMIYF